MYDYALIIHPINEELLHKYEPGMKHRPRALVKKVLEWMPPFKASEVEGLRSNLGRTAKGTLVMCPLLMEQMVSLSPSRVNKAVLNAIEFAKGFKPKIIGLTAYTAFSGNKGKDLSELIGIPLTIGTHYTLATLPEAILRAVDLMGIDLKSSQILIIGVTSDVGRYCLEVLVHFGQTIFVTAHNQQKLNILLAELPPEKRKKINSSFDINSILTKIKIIIVATNRIPAELDLNALSPGTVILDASYPRQIPNDLRKDILVIDGVAIRPPGKVNFNFDFGLPEGLCFPCMAEPMILALERKFLNYSLGKEYEPDKVKQILSWSKKHGFEIASLTSQEKIITDEEILKIKDESKKKKRKIFFWK